MKPHKRLMTSLADIAANKPTPAPAPGPRGVVTQVPVQRTCCQRVLGSITVLETGRGKLLETGLSLRTVHALVGKTWPVIRCSPGYYTIKAEGLAYAIPVIAATPCPP